jgi:hypothetical protein
MILCAGDAFMVAFATPLFALQWCLEAQVALLKCDWPKELLARRECKPVTVYG